MAEMTRVLRSGGQLRVVEASLGCSLADSRKTVECLRYPRLLQGVGAHFFRTCVAGAAISVDEAGDLTQDLQLEGVTVGLIAEAPAFWRIAARKLPACSKSVV
ncbi:hypothetical protein A5782_03300 [Mycobacterium sp. 852002-40037_SCH5390672]|nr:hypothetical protein A5782_03300 [Mycobacterium sp. 852002-40037_SCH5390672]